MLEFFSEFFQTKNFDLHAEITVTARHPGHAPSRAPNFDKPHFPVRSWKTLIHSH
jgi:hypothetical protein